MFGRQWATVKSSSVFILDECVTLIVVQAGVSVCAEHGELSRSGFQSFNSIGYNNNINHTLTWHNIP